MSENKPNQNSQRKNKYNDKNNNTSNGKSTHGEKGKGKGKIQHNQGPMKNRKNNKGSNQNHNDKEKHVRQNRNQKEEVPTQSNTPVRETSIFDLLGGVTNDTVIETPNIINDIFDSQKTVPIVKEFVYTVEELLSIFTEMNKDSLTKYVECDSVRRLIYNIQVEKDLDDEDDLWDMPNEDDEMDLSKPMDELLISNEASELARKIFNGEELHIPEDQKVAVMNALYSMNKMKWESMKKKDEFDGFTEQVIILSEENQENQENPSEETNEETNEDIEAMLLHEYREKQQNEPSQPAPAIEPSVEEPTYQSVPESLLPPVNQFLPTFQPLRDSNNEMHFASHIPKDPLFTSGLYPPRNYGFQPAMNPLDYNPTFMPSMPFSTFNDFGYTFNQNTQPPEVFDLYSDIKVDPPLSPIAVDSSVQKEPEPVKEEVKPVEKEEPKPLPKVTTSVTLKPRAVLMRKIRK